MLLIASIFAAALGSLLFSTLTYALRDMSRAVLTDLLESSNKSRWVEPTLDRREDLIFVTALFRLLFNLCILLAVMRLLQGIPSTAQYLGALAITAVIGLLCSVAVPHALAHHAGEAAVAYFVRMLHGLRLAVLPVIRLMAAIDRFVGRLAGANGQTQPEEIEQEILSVMEEGEKEGVVDEQEREMIESVIEFRDTQAGQIMTARPDIVALERGASLAEVKACIEESGHSRIPVYEGTLDQILGILYARDMLKHLGKPGDQFDMRTAMRPAVFVPETKPLRDLLREFRLQKVHIAIVLDEYGGTAGLVTIEDILEELVGEISDEHEPLEPPMLRRIDENSFEADARLDIDEANRQCGLNIPDDAGYDTLGGFVSITMGRIPAKGTSFEQRGARYTILDAEPQMVKRLRIDLLPQAVIDDRERAGE